MLLVTVFAFCTNRASLSPLLLRSFLFLHAFPSLFFRRKCVFPLVFLRGPSLPYPSIPQRGLRGSGRYFLTLKRRCARTVEMTVYAIWRYALYIYSSQLFKTSFPAPQNRRFPSLFRPCTGHRRRFGSQPGRSRAGT